MVKNRGTIWNSWAKCVLLAMSFILFGPFYGNKNDATSTRHILTPVKDIKPWPYGNDVLTVDICFRGGWLCWSILGYEAKNLHKYIKEKLRTQFQSNMLTYYAPIGAWFRKATKQDKILRILKEQPLLMNLSVCWLPVVLLYEMPSTSRHLNMSWKPNSLQ